MDICICADAIKKWLKQKDEKKRGERTPLPGAVFYMEGV